MPTSVRLARLFLALFVGVAAPACLQQGDTLRDDGGAVRLQPLVAEAAADGNAAAVLAAHLQDVAGAPLAGAPVRFGCTPNDVVLEAPAVSDAGGNVLASVRRTQVGEVRCSLSFQGRGVWLDDAGAATLRFVTPPPVQSLQLVATRDDAAIANGVDALAFRVVATPPLTGETLALDGLDARDVGDVGDAAANATVLALDANGGGNVVVRSTLAGSRTLRVTSQARPLGAAAPYRFVAGPADANHSQVSLAQRVVEADGSQTVALTVLLRDAFDNPVPGGGIALSSAVADARFDPPSGVADVNGQFACVLRAPAQAQVDVGVRLGATAAAAASAAPTLVTQVVYVLGPPDAAQSQLTVQPSVVVADGAATPNYTVVLRDANRALLPGRQGWLVATGPGAQAQNVAFVGGPDGVATVSGQPSTALGLRAVSLFSPSTLLTGNVVFVAGPAVADAGALTCAPCQAVADGQAAARVTACAVDAQGHPCAGQRFALASAQAGVTFAEASLLADANGCVATEVRSATVQAANVRLSQSGQDLATLALQFTLGPPDAATSQLTATAPPAPAADFGNVVLAGRVTDSRGRALAGQSVVLSVAEPTSTVQPRAVISDANGAYAAVLRARHAQTNVVVAKLGDAAVLRAGVMLAANPASCSAGVRLPQAPGPLYSPPNVGHGGKMRQAYVDADAYPDVVVTTTAQDSGNLFVLSGGPSGLATTPSFTADVPGTLIDLALGDFDGDGRPDFFTIDDANTLWLTSPTLPPRSATLSVPNHALCVGDFNGDGVPDAVVLAAYPTQGFTSLLGQSDGTLAVGSFVGGGSYMSSCAIADLDHDGFGDLIITDAGNTTLYTLHGNGDGTFTYVSGQAPGFCPNLTNLIVRDFDGDGWADAVASCTAYAAQPWTNQLLVWRNDGAGALQGHAAIPAGYVLATVQATEPKADGTVDLVAASPQGYALRFAGQSGALFAAPTAYGIGNQLGEVVMADFAGRGVADVAYTALAPAVGVLAADGNGTLPSLQVLPSLGDVTTPGVETHRLLACDLNGDGRTDFVRTQWNHPPLLLLQSADGTFTPHAVSSSAGARAVAVADFTGSGTATLMQGGFYDNSLCLFANAGDGLLQDCTVVADRGQRWYELVAGDINGDGLVDVVGAVDAPELLASYVGVGGGNVVAGPPIDASAASTYVPQTTGLTLVDVDNDGALDLVVGTLGNVFIYRNDGAGNFALAQTLPAPQSLEYPAPFAVAAADLDGDGYVDLACGSTWDAPWIFRNAGDGTFVVQQNASLASDALDTLSPLLLDVNGDGYTDLLYGVRSDLQAGLRVQLGGPNFAFAPARSYPSAVAGHLAGARGTADRGAVFAVASTFQENVAIYVADPAYGCVTP